MIRAGVRESSTTMKRGVTGFRTNAVRLSCRRLTNRSSGRVRDKVPSSYTGVRAAQLNR